MMSDTNVEVLLGNFCQNGLNCVVMEKSDPHSTGTTQYCRCGLYYLPIYRHFYSLHYCTYQVNNLQSGEKDSLAVSSHK